MSRLLIILAFIGFSGCASEEAPAPPSLLDNSESNMPGLGGSDPCNTGGSSVDSGSSDESGSNGGLFELNSLRLDGGGLFDDDSSSSNSSDSSDSSSNSADPCSTGSQSYTPTKNGEGVDLDEVWKHVIKPENWKKCHDAGFLYDWGWSSRDENKDEEAKTVSAERTCFNGQYGSEVIKFVDGCYDDLGTASSSMKVAAIKAGYKLFHERLKDSEGNQYTEAAIKKVVDEKIATWTSGLRPDQCGYKQSDDSPYMVFTKFAVTEENATVEFKILKP